tara:strand:+ start:1203 stop:1394 length:192 start_codon:yes stop_codon:yes gene_type:complete
VDIDLIISGVAFAVILLNAASLFLILSVRDRVGDVSKRIDAQAQRITRLTDWLEQKPTRKNAK